MPPSCLRGRFVAKAMSTGMKEPRLGMILPHSLLQQVKNQPKCLFVPRLLLGLRVLKHHHPCKDKPSGGVGGAVLTPVTPSASTNGHVKSIWRPPAQGR